MLIATYFELNPEKSPSEILDAFQKIQDAKIGEMHKKWEVKGWYITPDYWGVSIVDTDTVEDALRNANAWRLALPGIFTVFKTCMAAEVEQYAPTLVQLIRKFK
ncbi:MAG: hypothetical protein EU532_07715 [Promethearchaeota archaeon]|nr:MAG: hypothetical protein EU532_07715 [Candidatus Lokiarchaeota archaeon]